jgi:uncharacterized membrane protein YfcA
MDPLQFLILGLVGIVGGVVSGLIGGGGGIVFVPGLVYVAGWDIREAVAASLVIIVASALSGTIRNAWSENPVRWRIAGLLTIAVAPASLIGVYISRVSQETVVQVAFALLLIFLAYPISGGRREKSLEGSSKKIPIPLTLAAGIGTGALSGLLGIGGGVVLVPLLILGFGIRAKEAISTSLAVVMFTALVGAVGYILTGFEELLSLLPLIVCSILGAQLGVWLRELMPGTMIRRAFAMFMVVVAAQFLGEAAGIF